MSGAVKKLLRILGKEELDDGKVSLGELVVGKEIAEVLKVMSKRRGEKDSTNTIGRGIYLQAVYENALHFGHKVGIYDVDKEGDIKLRTELIDNSFPLELIGSCLKKEPTDSKS